MTQENYMALADVQELWTNQIKPTLQQKDDILYKEAYIGVGQNSSTVIVSANYREAIIKNKPISFNDASGYLCIALPSRYNNLIVMMNGVEVPMSKRNADISGKSYFVWSSVNSYTGSFNIYLL